MTRLLLWQAVYWTIILVLHFVFRYDTFLALVAGIYTAFWAQRRYDRTTAKVSVSKADR